MHNLFSYFDHFIHLSTASRHVMEEICSETSFQKNENLQMIGDTCRNIYFIKTGAARIYYYKDGNDITEHFAFEGNIIARVESLFTGKPSKKAIQALEDSTIIAINAVKLFKLYDDYPDIERLFRLIFEAEHVITVKRLESIQFHSAMERYLALMEEKEVVQRIPLKHIASYLGITQVSLSRIRASVS